MCSHSIGMKHPLARRALAFDRLINLEAILRHREPTTSKQSQVRSGQGTGVFYSALSIRYFVPYFSAHRVRLRLRLLPFRLLVGCGQVADDSVPDSASSGSSSRCAAHRISLVQGGRGIP